MFSTHRQKKCWQIETNSKSHVWRRSKAITRAISSFFSQPSHRVRWQKEKHVPNATVHSIGHKSVRARTMAAIVQVIGRTAASHEIKFCKLWTFLVRFCCCFRSNATRAHAHQLNSFVFTSDKNYCLRSDAHCSLLRCCLQSHLKILLIIHGDSAISSSHSRHLNRFNYFYVLFFSFSVRNKWIKFESTVARKMWHQMKIN